jgi:hypothetical protein
MAEQGATGELQRLSYCLERIVKNARRIPLQAAYRVDDTDIEAARTALAVVAESQAARREEA